MGTSRRGRTGARLPAPPPLWAAGHRAHRFRAELRKAKRIMPKDFATAAREIRIVHSSDLHVDDDRIAALNGGDGAGPLRNVLRTARHLTADIVILAGD